MLTLYNFRNGIYCLVRTEVFHFAVAPRLPLGSTQASWPVVVGILNLEWINWVINPLKPELNPIYYLLALLGAHHFLHVSRIRIKLLTNSPTDCAASLCVI